MKSRAVRMRDLSDLGLVRMLRSAYPELTVAAAAGLLYARTLSFSFVFDDHSLIGAGGPIAMGFLSLVIPFQNERQVFVPIGLGAFFLLNLILATFNLLPLPPLDGSAAVPLLLHDDTARRYQEWLWGNPALIWVGMIVAWRLFDAIFRPLFLAAVNLLYPGANYG